MRATQILHPPMVRRIIRRILPAWLLAVTLEFFLIPGNLRSFTNIYTISQMSLLRVIVFTGAWAILLELLFRYTSLGKWERWALPGAITVVSGVTLLTTHSVILGMACAFLLLISCIYSLRGWNDSPLPTPTPRKAPRLWLWLTVGLSLAFFLVICAWSIFRYLTYHCYTYDFGIFCQMFHSMKTTGLPVTTLERDQVLSHFQVHMSPIYYLMLPFYWLFPSPITLQVLQAAVITSAVIPLWKLGGHHGLSGPQRFMLCAVLLFFPAFSGGTNLDLHENCFLTPLLLWLFYGIDRRRLPVISVTVLLTLLVKEDAAIYVAVIGLWLLVTGLLRRDRWSGIVGSTLAGVSVLYFLAVTAYLARYGDGVMSNRYANLMLAGEDSLLSVLKCVFLSPTKALYECVDPSKLSYIALTMAPLLGMPLFTRRFERYLLLIPFLLINLLSYYTYQHDIFYQYNFGSLAFLLYLTLINLVELKTDRRRLIALTAAGAIGMACCCKTHPPKLSKYLREYLTGHEAYATIDQTLALIPEDAAVASDGKFTPHIADRTLLYDLYYCSEEHLLSSEYVIMEVGGKHERYGGTEALISLLTENGYTLHTQIENQLLIYTAPSIAR